MRYILPSLLVILLSWIALHITSYLTEQPSGDLLLMLGLVHLPLVGLIVLTGFIVSLLPKDTLDNDGD